MRQPVLFLLFNLLMIVAYGQSPKEIMYVGTYSVRGSEGIYVFTFDRKTGTMQPVQTVSHDMSPAFMAIHPSGNYLYSVINEGTSKPGGVSAYSIDKATGKLTYLNSQPSKGDGPCYVSIDKTGQMAFVANYGGGNFTVLPIKSDGILGEPTATIQDEGKGPNAQRQEKPHMHSATLAPDNRFVYVADLGIDRVNIFAIDPKTSTVKPAQTPYVSVKPGSGPRHFTFHPNGKYAYLAEELTSSVAVFSRDAKTGALTLMQDNIPTLPANFTGQNISADIHIDPSGKFLYQSNRGYDGLTIFAIDNDGSLTRVAEQPGEGKTPRNFLIDPKGEFVFIANQASDTITIFRRDAKTGKLTFTGQSVSVPSPVCVLMTESR